MAKLTDLQKHQLIQREPNTNVNKMLEYIQKFENLSLDDFPQMSADRKQYIEKQLSSLPNPEEQKEWADIALQQGNPTQELLIKLNNYIKRWEGSRPSGNHVDEAWNLVNNVENSIKELQAQEEQADWDNVDTLSTSSLISYLHKYPNTVHKNEIDDSVWGLVDKENIQEIQNYLSLFALGLHKQEAKNILDSIVEWNNVKNSNDIFIINDYVQQNPNSPFKQQALILIASLKQGEISMMRNDPNHYSLDRLLKLIGDGITTERELINERAMTQNVLATLLTPNFRSRLPDVNKAIAESEAECKDGYTDVFFFGIPSTGKTCVLMGISKSDSININTASKGGKYAEALQLYTKKGVTIQRTPGSFVTTLDGEIYADEKLSIVHKVNLVEMSGEEFAFEIVNNPRRNFTFEEMGTGVTQLLQNNNRKAFFLIIDPTVTDVIINRDIYEYDETTGERVQKGIETVVVDQQISLKKMIDLFKDPSNAEIMKKVDSIHIIMTKADVLGGISDREEKAFNLFNRLYAGKILRPLHELCKEYSINTNTEFYPKLYTFSLGTFYVGGLYEYDQTDSDRLIRAIQNSTSEIKKKTWWNKLKEILN